MTLRYKPLHEQLLVNIRLLSDHFKYFNIHDYSDYVKSTVQLQRECSVLLYRRVVLVAQQAEKVVEYFE